MPELKNLPGSDIKYRSWPAAETRAVLLLVHGLGAHSARWNFFGEHLSSKGFTCYAIELKGYGETQNVPGHVDSFAVYYKDIISLYGLARKEHPGKKIFILAESMGSLISFLLAAKQPELFAGQILISPAFKSNMAFPISAYFQLITSLLYNQKKPIKVPFTSAMCTRDVAYQKKMDADKRESRVASAQMLLNNLLGQVEAKSAAKKVSIPTLFLLAGKDYLVDPKESRRIYQKLAVKDKRLFEYPEMLHALSIELGKEQVFADILEWLKKRS
ncbi:MAG: lysophospholipase [Candidatus Margulisbacteria bacterium]|nr:lysophospholipase [Candidatus Margulisiibacteriota bacterium]